MSLIMAFLLGIVVGVVALIIIARNNDDVAEKLMGDDFFLSLYEVAVEEIREEVEKAKKESCTCGENEACSNCSSKE